jgi:hypothetical protein
VLIVAAISTSMLINVNFFKKHVVIYDNWGDWQAAQHIAKKYDDDGYLRKKE